MEEKKVIFIFKSGGFFQKSEDGSLSYSGGNARAICIDKQITFDEFQLELGEMFGCSSIGTMSIKYIIPGYSKTLITISNDKDFRSMIKIHGDSVTIELYVMNDEMLPLDVSNMQQCIRSSQTTLPKALAPNTTLELIAPPVSGFGDTNQVESHIDIPFEVSTTMPRGDPNDAKLWKNAITGVGQTFNSVDELRESIRKYAIAHQFAFRFKKNDSDRVIVKCKTEGCPWEIHALRSPESAELFRIQKMASEHDCDKAAATTGHQVTSSLVAGFIEEKLKVLPNYCYKIKDIVSDFKQEHGIQITYQQARRAKMKANGIEITNQPARRAKKKAEKGQPKEHRRSPPLGEMITVEEEHRQTPLLCEMIIEENPGSLATYTTKDDSTFPGRFFAFRASLLGFQQGCRPLLFLDSILLPSKNLLLTASTVDGDASYLPIAFAVVDRENEKNWHHFLLQLKAFTVVGRENADPFTFYIDSRYGLKESISNVFPGSFHAFYVEDLIDELFEELKMPISSDVKNKIEECCYKAYQPFDLEGFHESLERIKGISSEAYNWISNIEPTNWSAAFLPGEVYNTRVEYLDEFMFDIREACEEVSSVTQLVHDLGVWTMKLIIERRTASAQWMSRLTPSKELMLKDLKWEAGNLEVLRSAGSTYEVGGVFLNEEFVEVDIDKRDCSCGWWQINGIPCIHLLAVILLIDGNPCEYCSRYCTTENYRLTYSFE